MRPKVSPGRGRGLGSDVAAESLDGSSAACLVVTGRGQLWRAGVGHRGITPRCFIAAQATAAAAAAPLTEEWLGASELDGFLSTWRPNAPRSWVHRGTRLQPAASCAS